MEGAFVRILLKKLENLITEESNLLAGVEGEIGHLQRELRWMSQFLIDADIKPITDGLLNVWVTEVRELTFQAEDIIDEFMLNISYQRRRRQQQCVRNDLGALGRFLKSCVGSISQLRILHELGSQIKVINTRMEKLSARKDKYLLEGAQVNSINCESSCSRSEVSDLQKARVRRGAVDAEEKWDLVEMDDSTQKVKSLLIGGQDYDEQQMIVVSIVGMGGLGKTTLARKIFNCDDVRREFDCFVWLDVSQEYSLKELRRSILKSITLFTGEEEEEEEEEDKASLRGDPSKSLQNNKCLIVLDDVWDTNVWDGLKDVFLDDMNGSRVLLTTRNEHVALHADSSFNNIHKLRCLNDRESWELFQKKIYPSRIGGRNGTAQKIKCPPELEDLGKQMAKKCCGLPLAIVVLGSLLSSKEKTLVAWSRVNASVSWHLTHGDSSDSCSGILALSYYDLPYYLRPCFLYMSLFPEDSEIRATKLFQCWMAEGFVQKRGQETMEDVAEDYMEELIHRSLVQVGSWRSDGRIKTCRVHDLLRDLSIKKSTEGHFSQIFVNKDESQQPTTARRVAIHGHFDALVNEQYFSEFPCARATRSLICLKAYFEDTYLKSLCGGFKLLRVLELKDILGLRTLPKEIGELTNLRYISIERIKVASTTSYSLSKLVNLQTLNLNDCSGELNFDQIWSLHQLRHLYLWSIKPAPNLISTGNRCFPRPSSACEMGIDNLRNLRTLCIQAGDWIYNDGLATLSLLKKLFICNNSVSGEKAISSSLAKLNGLRSLQMLSDGEVLTSIQFSNHALLKKLSLHGRLSCLEKYLKHEPMMKLQFPPNLTKLSLWGSHLETDPIVVLEKLPHLIFLILGVNSYVGKKLVIPEGGFGSLQLLDIRGLHGLEDWTVENGAFGSLRRLRIYGCRKLKMVPDGIQQVTTLQEIKISGLPKKFMSRLVENAGEDWEKVKHVPSLILKS